MASNTILVEQEKIVLIMKYLHELDAYSVSKIYIICSQKVPANTICNEKEICWRHVGRKRRLSDHKKSFAIQLKQKKRKGLVYESGMNGCSIIASFSK